jgi:hypothetical protein
MQKELLVQPTLACRPFRVMLISIGSSKEKMELNGATPGTLGRSLPQKQLPRSI